MAKRGRRDLSGIHPDKLLTLRSHGDQIEAARAEALRGIGRLRRGDRAFRRIVASSSDLTEDMIHSGATSPISASQFADWSMEAVQDNSDYLRATRSLLDGTR